MPWNDETQQIIKSYLVRANGDNVNVAIFKGTLDIDTLGGAGFASQRTVTESEVWDLSEYDGLRIVLRPLASDSQSFNPGLMKCD